MNLEPTRRLADLAVSSVLDGMPSPAVIVDELAVEQNLAVTLAAMATPDRWRAHFKTARTAWAVRRLLTHNVTRFKASTVGELRFLLASGARDVLLAHPAVGPAQREVAALAARFPDAMLSVLVDSVEGASLWEAPMNVVIDIDTGMGRTGVPVGDHAAVRNLAETLARLGHRLVGVHAYDGNLADLPPVEKQSRVEEELASIDDLVRELTDAGHPVHEVVLGGSHTFLEILASWPATSWSERLTLGPGTVLYNDVRSLERFARAAKPASYIPAAAVHARVVSRGTGTVTVDAGLTAIQVDAGRPHAVAISPPHLSVRSVSQEHLVLACDAGPVPAIGDSVLLLPRHIDTAVAQFSCLYRLGPDQEVVREPVAAAHPDQ
ncbi:alanine racemase [Spirillospora sp. NPDC049024]